MVEVKESLIHGFGVFAAEDLEVGHSLTIPYAILDEDGTDMIFNNSFVGWYPSPEIPWAYLNHSETPNAEIIDDSNKLMLVLLRDVDAGEELTIDYGSEYNWK